MNGYNEELGGGGIWTKAVVVVVNSIQNLYIEFVRNEKIIVLAKLKVSLKIIAPPTRCNQQPLVVRNHSLRNEWLLIATSGCEQRVVAGTFGAGVF